ncbi:MAG: hypothetical protein GEU80_02080 [Dehalococcoidia bacterium]|nr:hypothetical protein [Dehalococcoidia bacterium]
MFALWPVLGAPLWGAAVDRVAEQLTFGGDRSVGEVVAVAALIRTAAYFGILTYVVIRLRRDIERRRL